MVEIKAVIQAGGRGTRLAPYSTVLPKALMPIGDSTVIDHMLGQFRDAGVQEVIITLSKFGRLIQSYCGDGSSWDLEIDYLSEEAPLGTIAPLRGLRDRLTGPFFVANSDIYADLELKDLMVAHLNDTTPMTVVVTRQDVNIAYGVLDHTDGVVVAFREKPTQQFSVSSGIYCMSPDVFDFIPPSGPFGFDDLMYAMLGGGAKVSVYEHMGSWVDIGRVEDLRRAQERAVAPLVDSDEVS